MKRKTRKALEDLMVTTIKRLGEVVNAIPELKPFFQLSYEEWLKKFESGNSDPLGVAINITSRHIPQSKH